jgi:SAM-dependent methyltransferase
VKRSSLSPRSRLASLWPLSGVSREQIRWCYQQLLQREPESEVAVDAHLGCTDFEHLVRSITASPEYQRLRRRRPFRPLPLPPMAVETDASPEQLAEIIARMRQTWQGLGDARPHFSVMTNEAFLPERVASSLDLFWASGDFEAGQVAAIAASHGASLASAVCVEFGCGVGRVTGGLARHCARVHGYDISAPHLALARQRLDALALAHVDLHLCADNVLEPLQPCDLLYSRIVLQHNPPPLMERLVHRFLQCLRPGGLAIFQLPTFAEDYAFSVEKWLQAPVAQDMEMHCLPQSRVLQAVAEHHCELLELREEDSPGDDRYISNLFVVRRRLA